MTKFDEGFADDETRRPLKEFFNVDGQVCDCGANAAMRSSFAQHRMKQAAK
jgi:hypothetical protein